MWNARALDPEIRQTSSAVCRRLMAGISLEGDSRGVEA